MTGIFNVLEQTYEKAYRNLIGVSRKYWKKLFVLCSLKGILCFPLFFEGMWLYASYNSIVTKTIMIGDFVVLANAIVSTTWMLMDLTDSISKTYQNGLYKKVMRTFLSYEEKIPEDWDGIAVPEKVKTLELKNVSFMYPGQADGGKYALRNMNYTFYAGKRTALVGYNGSGKSTLIKPSDAPI